MNNFVCVGRILKPQALKGEVKISSNAREISNFLSYKYLYLGQNREKYIIEQCRIQDGYVIAKLEGVDDANIAESLRNIDVFIDNYQLDVLPDDEYYVQDLIGINVFSADGATYLGQITAIDNFSSADVVTIVRDEREFLFPFLAEVVIDVDIDDKKMFVDMQKFEEVCVDEN